MKPAICYNFFRSGQGGDLVGERFRVNLARRSLGVSVAFYAWAFDVIEPYGHDDDLQSSWDIVPAVLVNSNDRVVGR